MKNFIAKKQWRQSSGINVKRIGYRIKYIYYTIYISKNKKSNKNAFLILLYCVCVYVWVIDCIYIYIYICVCVERSKVDETEGKYQN